MLSLHRLVAAEKAVPKGKKPELELHAATKQASSSAAKGKANEKFDKKSALPVKEGKPDAALYDTFPSKSLRRRLWDAVVAGKCTRCNGPHLRIACPKPRQSWEDDFEKEDFFTKPPPPAKPQSRVQLTGKSMNLPVPAVLSVQTPIGRFLIDTCSDVSVSRRDVLFDLRPVRDPVVVGHMGGESLLHEAGSLLLEGSEGSPPVILSDVFVVQPETLPAGVVAPLGVADIASAAGCCDGTARRSLDSSCPHLFFGKMPPCIDSILPLLSPPPARPHEGLCERGVVAER